MGIGDLMSGEDCCLRQRKEKVIELRRLFVIFSCLQAAYTHRLGFHIVHSFLTYRYSNVLGQNTENYYSTEFTTGTSLAVTSHDRVLQYATTTLGGTASKWSRPCCSLLSQRPSISIVPSFSTESPSFHETQGGLSCWSAVIR